MKPSYKTCESIQKHVSNSQFQDFSSKIPSLKTQPQLYTTLSEIIKENNLAEQYAKTLYLQISASKIDKAQDNKALIQIAKIIKNQKQLEKFKKQMGGLSLKQMKDQLANYTGKIKAYKLAQQLYQQLLSNNQKSSQTLQKIKNLIKQQQFINFQQNLKSFTTVEQIFQQLSNYIGKIKAKNLAQKLFVQLGNNQSKKDKVLAQIEKQIQDKQSYLLFVNKISTLTKQEIIDELQNFMKKTRAQTLGQQLFNQLNKDIDDKSKIQLNPNHDALSKVEKLINDKHLFFKFERKLMNMVLIEELIEQLTSYVNKKQAKQLAELIFKETGKDKLVYDKIQLMYRSLAQKDVDQMSIQNIRKLVQQGKKSAVKRVICKALGPFLGAKLFNQYSSEIKEKIAQPIPGSKFINDKHGLKMYQYKQSVLQAQKSGAKTIIVFGETGCGKSTFLNSIVNYIVGVQMEDEFRYKIIVENEESQKNSITSKITSYYIRNNRNKQLYRLVDTPGFGDTRGLEKDNEIVEMVKKAFKSEIQSVHNILFLLKSSTTRVTHYQRYVFQNIMDLFNKNIAPNFVFIFTFSDSGKPQVLESVQDKTYGFGNYWHLIQDPKYLQVNNCGIFEKIDEGDKIKVGYWQVGMLCMERLFNKIHKIKPQSLSLSRELLDKRQALANKMKIARQKIENAIAKRQNLINQLQKTIQFQQQIDNNKDFSYEVEVQEYYTLMTADNVTRCINCTDCNCHQSCNYGDGLDKRQCVAFDKMTGNCTICPGKCHFTCHRNEHFLRLVRNVKKTKQNSTNKKIYEQSSSKLKKSQSLINNLMEQIDVAVKTTIVSTKQMVQIQKELLDQQMSSKKPQSTIQYLQHLISNQEREKMPGYQNRIKGMNQIIKEFNFYQEMLKNNGKIQEKVVKSFQYDIIMDRINKTNNQGLISKFKNFFEKWKN